MQTSDRPSSRSDQRKNFSIGLIGITAEEQRHLQGAFGRLSHRTITYRLVAIDASPEILLVNADAKPALAEWVRYREALRKVGEARVPPSVVVSRERSFDTRHYQVRGPLIATRTLGVLDQLAMTEFDAEQELAFVPEAVRSRIPVAPPPQVPAESRASTAEPTHAPRRHHVPASRNVSIRALVVDDSLPVRIQMQQALNPIASRIDFAENGEEAHELINRNDYDIIFLDVILPGMDGYEICKAVKSGRAAKTPVIMLTSASSPADRVKGQLAGCDTYLIKPVGHALFQEVIEQYLQVH
jgi:twitching motility two-component system response regulator PilG